MSLPYAVLPPSHADGARTGRGSGTQQQPLGRSSHLSPHPSLRARSNSASPGLNIDTPASSVYYQSSEFSDIHDPFFGVDFNAPDTNSPSFLGSDAISPTSQDHYASASPDLMHDPTELGIDHLLSPDNTPYSPSADLAFPPGEGTDASPSHEQPHHPVSPRTLTGESQPPTASTDVEPSAFQLTPDTSAGSPSGDEVVGVAPGITTPVMANQSPRVTVEVWGNDGSAEEGPLPASRGDDGQWLRDETTGQSGLDPSRRPLTKLDTSINDLAAERGLNERNQGVRSWLEGSPHPDVPTDTLVFRPRPEVSGEQDDNIDPKEVPVYDTENRLVPGQTYIRESGSAEVTDEDIRIMRANRNWADGPALHPIQTGGPATYQPESSQAAIDKFLGMCRDTESIVSRAATWGTRRRSCPSVFDDAERVASVGFLKKLSISRGDGRRPSILGNMRTLLRKPSTTLKRNRPAEDALSTASPVITNGREVRDSLAPPPARTPSAASTLKRPSVPSINTALVSVSNSAASIGTAHVRGSSPIVSPAAPSPRSPINLSSLGVRSIMRRPRSASENTAGLADMWKRSGGPPVTNLARPAPPAGLDDDGIGDEEDEANEEEPVGRRGESSSSSSSSIGAAPDIEATPAGFRSHILKLNPALAHTNTYLVERIAYQQSVRYKDLLDDKIAHFRAVHTGTCRSGAACAFQGAKTVTIKREPRRSSDPLSAARSDGSEGEMGSAEGGGVGGGGISPESFPAGIPMPPTSTLPATVECPVCFQFRKFDKPSDWSKHIREDVHPFVCTWPPCRERKAFKRKADWVRHENEGHRHVEWWACDVDDCKHLCYRRDNFIQHLVREHKFDEPRIRTKAAVKRAGGRDDPTWRKVEGCHRESPKRPQDEPCRFCHRSFSSWKKLTGHLAKHMEEIALPVLALVNQRDVGPDTVVSPVQDLSPGHFASPTPNGSEPAMLDTSPTAGGMAHPPLTTSMPYQQVQLRPPFGYYTPTPAHGSVQPPSFYGTRPMAATNSHADPNPFDVVASNLESTHIGSNMHAELPFGAAGAAYGEMPASNPAYISPSHISPSHISPSHISPSHISPSHISPSRDMYSSGTVGVEPFPPLTSMNTLGLHEFPNASMDGQVPYGGMITPGPGTEQFSSYRHSPGQSHGYYGPGGQ